MKLAILVTGGNASGKTTMVLRALEPWEGDERVLAVRADNDHRYKGTADFQRGVIRGLWLGPTPVLVFEGTRINTPLMDVAKELREERELLVIMTVQPPDVMKAHMISRCAALVPPKKFNEEYWTRAKLTYEGQKRYPNSFRKNGVRPVTYDVDAGFSYQGDAIALVRARVQAVLSETFKVVPPETDDGTTAA